MREEPPGSHALPRSTTTGLLSEELMMSGFCLAAAYLLDRSVAQGEPAVMVRFDSNKSIAEAWERLRSGQYTSSDLQLLRHETAEAWLMKEHGSSYSASHETA